MKKSYKMVVPLYLILAASLIVDGCRPKAERR